MKFAAGLLFLYLTAPFLFGGQPALSDDTLRNIEFDQKIGGQISPGLEFFDEQGRAVRLGDYFGKPSILVLGYYRCPMLCTMVLNGLISSLQDLKPSVGERFSVIFVSIDPSETPSLAAAKKANYLKLYGRRASASGWHFLTGPQTSIDALAKESGYRYAYDPASRQFAHPSGLAVLTSDGKIARYFFGISFSATDLDKALRDASSNELGSEVRQFVYLCFHYNPIRGKYGALVIYILRLGGIVTLACLAAFIVSQRRSEYEIEARK